MTLQMNVLSSILVKTSQLQYMFRPLNMTAIASQLVCSEGFFDSSELPVSISSLMVLFFGGFR